MNNKDSYVVVDWGDLVMARQIEKENTRRDVFVMDREHAKRMIKSRPDKFDYRELSETDWIGLRNSVSFSREPELRQATTEEINQSNKQPIQPIKMPNKKMANSFWKKPPNMAWQIIGVIVAIILTILVIMANKGII